MALEVPLVLEIEKYECLYNFNLTEYNRKDVLDQAWQEVATAVNLPVRECKDKWRNIRSSFLRSLKTLSGGRTKKPYYLTKYLQFVCPYLKPVDSVEVSFEDNETNDDDANNDDDNAVQSVEVKWEDKNTEELKIKIEPVTTEEEMFDPLTSIVDAEEDEHAVIEMADKPLNKLRKRKRRRQNVSMEPTSTSRQKSNIGKRPMNSLRGADNFAMRYFLLSLLPEFDSMDERQIRQFKIKVMKLIEDIKTGRPNHASDESRQSDSEKRLINLLIKNLKK